MTIIEKARTLAEKQGWEFIEGFHFPHPDDSFMIMTIVKLKSIYGETYATHIFNESLGENGSYNLGRYDIETLEQAKANIEMRMV
jgi:hypothetical protein